MTMSGPFLTWCEDNAWFMGMPEPSRMGHNGNTFNHVNTWTSLLNHTPSSLHNPLQLCILGILLYILVTTNRTQGNKSSLSIGAIEANHSELALPSNKRYPAAGLATGKHRCNEWDKGLNLITTSLCWLNGSVLTYITGHLHICCTNSNCLLLAVIRCIHQKQQRLYQSCQVREHTRTMYIQHKWKIVIAFIYVSASFNQCFSGFVGLYAQYQIITGNLNFVDTKYNVHTKYTCT